MNLKQLQNFYSDNGCQKIYVKVLSPNDNSKNQIYFGGNFEILNIFPVSNIETESAGSWERERFKALINFSWISDDGKLYPAPKSQFILYPKYPEVRFSGFLIGCENPPSDLMTQRLDGRYLFLSVSNKGVVLGYIASPSDDIVSEIQNIDLSDRVGVFMVFDLPKLANNKERLLNELRRIHKQGWIVSKRLNKGGQILPCPAPNCGGYTLEAELGITPNGYSEPDFLGWEVKQFGVDKFDKLNSKVITLMTPEPTDGIYVTEGIETFINLYGYFDKKQRSDRKNFGGIHKSGKIQSLTGLELKLIGFDVDELKIRNTNGMIALLDKRENIAASWSFASLLLHWNRKHNQACYIPSLTTSVPEKKYKYGSNVLLGTGTDFKLFLSEMANGNIYYDPGIKMENISTKVVIKRRSQFRIKSGNLKNLYFKNELINIEN
jgi:hypothetical protein